MDKKQLRRWNELNDMDSHTDEQKAEFEELDALKTASDEAEVIAKSVGKALKGMGLDKDEIEKIKNTSKNEEVGKDAVMTLLEKNADYRFSMLLHCSAAKDLGRESKFLEKYGKSAKEMIDIVGKIEKAADPMNEATPGDGGYLVPTITESNIRELIPTYGQAYKYFQVMPLTTGNPINLPKEGALPTVYWVAENAPITESQPEIGVDTLTIKKATALSTVTNELLNDANPNIGAYVVKKMAQAIGTAIDIKAFQNSNTTFSGVFYASNTFGNTELTSGINPNTLTYQDIINCFTGIDNNLLGNAAWHMSRTIYAIVLGMVDDQNRPLIQPSFDNPLGNIFGFPVRIIEKAPDSTAAASKPIVLLGDLTNSILGEVGGISFKLFEEGTVSGTSLIENDLTGIRAIKRVGLIPGMTQAYSIIKTAAA